MLGRAAVASVQPDDPSRPRFGRLALATGAFLGFAVLSLVLAPSLPTLWARVSDVSVKAESWEQLPGIERAMKKAQSMQPVRPLRSLNDLFFDSQPEEVPWIKTECVVDSVQAMAYLGEAITFLYRAIDSPERRCPETSAAGCAMSVAGFVTSITWVSSFLALTANACGKAINTGALCSGDFLALMANFAELATAAAAIENDCDRAPAAVDYLLREDKTEEEKPKWHEFIPAGAGPTVEKIHKVQEHKRFTRNRDFDYFQCSMDVTQAASFLIRAVMQIRTASIACPDPTACAINILNIISSFAAIAQFTLFATADCTVTGYHKIECAADIVDVVVDLTNGPAAGLATTSDCQEIPDLSEIDEIGPRD
ncbi:UVR8 [Symbiodinium sp. CCMP2592]|nr:UVR8 [Symbiodinium sp. CCMP2592]